MAKDTLVAVDLAKSVFEVAVSHHPGQVAQQKRYSRAQFPLVLARLPPAPVVMEACGSAHFWARRIQSLGHQALLLPPHAVRPYVRRNKTDRTDTKGMLEAYRNEESVPSRSSPSPSRPWPHYIASAPAGSPSAPPASTPCAACSASSGS